MPIKDPIKRREYFQKYTKEHRSERRIKCLETSGRKTFSNLNKRPRPDCCELCGKQKKKLDYHHWDDPNIGIWICVKCHRFVEAIEDGYLELKIIEKYLQFKQSLKVC